jgi:5-methylcytosine-specific restriction endonuclease McrA
MADRRYSTAAWQRLRRAVLDRDGHICQIQGPRCTGVATSVDHIYPSSTHPHLFWSEENLRAACRKCNYGRGSSVAAANARAREAELRAQVVELLHEVDRLAGRLSKYEGRDGKPLKPQLPAIY